jgi:hypothetical protein
MSKRGMDGKINLDQTVPILTVDQLLDQAEAEFRKRYAADNGEDPSADQVKALREMVLEHAQVMHANAMREFELGKKNEAKEG